jgi:hypothetical protein
MGFVRISLTVVRKMRTTEERASAQERSVQGAGNLVAAVPDGGCSFGFSLDSVVGGEIQRGLRANLE